MIVLMNWFNIISNGYSIETLTTHKYDLIALGNNNYFLYTILSIEEK